MKSFARFFRYVLLLALVVLVMATVAGPAGWIPDLTSNEHAAVPPGADVLPSARDVKMVVCTGYADLEYGVTSLYPSQPGRVVAIPVHENDRVSAGAVLLRLDDSQAQLRLDEAESALKVTRVQLIQAQQVPEQHRAQLALQQSIIRSVQHRAESARHTLQAKQRLQAIEAVGRERPDPVLAEELAAANEKVQELKEEEKAQLQKLVDLQLHDPVLEVQRAEADVATMQTRLKLAQRAVEECTLKAPQQGTVLRILVRPGELVSGQSTAGAVQFCPDQPYVIRAEIDQEFASRLAVDQPALIEDDVTPGSGWHGRVSRIADWYSQRRSLGDDALQRKDVRTLECIVAINSGQRPLRIGQRMRVTINWKPS
jgi:multidrug resistance efflux pump